MPRGAQKEAKRISRTVLIAGTILLVIGLLIGAMCLYIIAVITTAI